MSAGLPASATISPAYSTSKVSRGRVKKGPILSPGKVFDWSLIYEPGLVDGKGSIVVTLGADRSRSPCQRLTGLKEPILIASGSSPPMKAGKS